LVVSIARWSSSRLSANWYGEVGRPSSSAARRRNDLGEPFAFDGGEHVGGDRLDLRHDDLRFFLLDEALQRRRVGHRDDVRAVRDLVPRRVGVAIDGDDLDPQPLEGDDDFLAQFAAAEQHHPGRGR
jgi:hypothetical protein